MELRKCRLEGCVLEIYTWTLLNKLKLNKDKTELLVISSLHRARPPLSHIHVCDERCAGFTKKRETLEFSSMNLWEWFLRWQQCANPHSIVSVKLGSFVNISPLMQPSFLFKLLLHQSLTTEIRYCMVYLRTWLNSSNVCRTQLLVFLLFRPKFCHITTVLANLHWLSIYLQIEFKILIVTSGKPLHGLAPAYIKDLLQSYLPARDLRSILSCLLLA